MKTALVFLWIAAGCAQAQADAVARANDISDRYNECVYFSAVSRLSAANDDSSLAVEGAFASCETEKSQMVLLMQQEGHSAAQIETVLLDKKTGIKREFRKMVLEAKGIKQ